MTRTTTVRFPVARHQARRRGQCPECGKTVNRTRVFEATQNPFNKGVDGEPLDFISVMMQARLEAELWEPDFTHAKCAEDLHFGTRPVKA